MIKWSQKTTYLTQSALLYYVQQHERMNVYLDKIPEEMVPKKQDEAITSYIINHISGKQFDYKEKIIAI